MKITTPIKAIEEQTRRNIEMFQNAMRMFTPFPPASRGTKPAPEPSRPQGAAGKTDDLAGAEGADRGDAAQDRLDGLRADGPLSR